jgi:hypothetical protein
LVDRAITVALHPRDALERCVELLGDDLPQRRRHTGSQLHFAAEDRNGSIGRYDQPGVEL